MKDRFPTFEDFKTMAGDRTLSVHERIGFADEIREGMTPLILEDIRTKLRALNEREKTILDIGSGCGELAKELVRLCEQHGHRLVRIDSREVLEAQPAPRAKLCPGKFPQDFIDDKSLNGVADAVLVYSVLQYVVVEGGVEAFVDRAVECLKPGGELLLGDLPNASARARVLEAKGDPIPAPTRPELDDERIEGIVRRYRERGYESRRLPQETRLPMSNRREDILIRKPR